MAKRTAKRVGSSRPGSITGLVDARGNVATKPPGARRWTMRFTFKAWRAGDGPVVHKPMAVEVALTNAQWMRGMRTVGPNTVVRIATRAAPVAKGRAASVVARQIEGRVTDVALRRAQLSDQMPATLRDPVLGTLKRSDGAWPSLGGRAKFSGRRIRVRVEGPTRSTFERALRHTHDLWSRQEVWLAKIRPAVVKHWLREANGTWRLDGAPELTAEQFWKRLKPTDLSVDSTGKVWLDLDAGEMFGGHAIVVITSVSGRVRDFDLCG